MEFLLKMRLRYLFFLLMTISPNVESLNLSAWNVFCAGEILHTVQMSGLYTDSKTFVDMKMKLPISEIFIEFRDMMAATKGKPHRLHVRRFVRKCFSPPGSEFERCVPVDWVAEPSIINNIDDIPLKAWAMDLISKWRPLCRKMLLDVHENSDAYSMIYIPNPFMLAGGRNRESRYWDSYWITIGLLRSDMYGTAKGIIENFLFLIKKYGFVPNGNRIYLLGRSSFPLLTSMVGSYFVTTQDINFLKKHISTLETEFNFWIEYRVIEFSVGNNTFSLARYNATNIFSPRPEEYFSDISSARYFSTDNKKKKFYQELRSACESGWDFSSRWYLNERNKGRFQDTKVRSIIPVDLNAVIYLNAKKLSEFYHLLNMNDKSEKYKNMSERWKQSVNTLLWSEEEGMWFDYDMKTKKLRKHYYISNTIPLWCQCYDENQTDVIAEKVVIYLKKNGITNFKGGIPTSLIYTGLRWDFPNAIPSVQHLLIMGLEATKNQEATKLAYSLAENWIRSNYIGYRVMNSMYDAYDVRKPGTPRGIETHIVQVGYGWTNGVILDLLNVYGNNISVRDIKSCSPLNTLSILPLILYILIICVLR